MGEPADANAPLTDHAELYQAVGRRVRQAREGRRMTQEALAKRIKMTRTSITNIERGRQKLLLHTLMDIASALSVEPSVLLPARSSASEEQIEAALPEALSPKAREWIRSLVTPNPS